MMTLSPMSVQLLAELLEGAEETISVCSDIDYWNDRKPLIEELWGLYSQEVEKLQHPSQH